MSSAPDALRRPEKPPVRWSQDSLSPVDKLVCKCLEFDILFRDVFEDFDPLHRGFCTVNQVRTLLTLTKLDREITEKDFVQLAETFIRPEDGMFNYDRLCRIIEEAYRSTGEERVHDWFARRVFPGEATMPARRKRQVLTEEEAKAVAKVEADIRARIEQRRILVVPSFKDFDRMNTQHFTKAQFGRVMAAMGFELSFADIDLLCKKYCDLGTFIDFNYHDFLETVDPSLSQKFQRDNKVEDRTYMTAQEYFDKSDKVIPFGTGPRD